MKLLMVNFASQMRLELEFFRKQGLKGNRQADFLEIFIYRPDQVFELIRVLKDDELSRSAETFKRAANAAEFRGVSW